MSEAWQYIASPAEDSPAHVYRQSAERTAYARTSSRNALFIDTYTNTLGPYAHAV